MEDSKEKAAPKRRPSPKNGITLPDSPGRPKGVPNKSTSLAREAIAIFVDGNAERLSSWLDEVYHNDGAKEAFKCFASLIDYHVPKLSRQEISGLDGKDLYPATPEVDNAILDRYLEQKLKEKTNGKRPPEKD
jgi:hypothetical protein